MKYELAYILKTQGLNYFFNQNHNVFEKETACVVVEKNKSIPKSRVEINSEKKTSTTETTTPNYNDSQEPHAPILPKKLSDYLCRHHTPTYSIWTYEELGDDILGTPDTQRRILWKNISKAIHKKTSWTKDDYLFWPIAQSELKTEINLDLFSLGCRIIAPVYIFCFGKKLCDLLNSSAHKSSWENIKIISLPRPKDLIANTEASKQKTWELLCRYAPKK